MGLQVTVRVTTTHHTQTTVNLVVARRKKMKKTVRMTTMKMARAPLIGRTTTLILTADVHPRSDQKGATALNNHSLREVPTQEG